MSKSKGKKKADSKTKKAGKAKEKSETEVKSKTPAEAKPKAQKGKEPKAQKGKEPKEKAEKGPGIASKIRRSMISVSNFVQKSLIAVSAFLRRNIKGIAALLGILLLLWATTLPAISFVFDNIYQDAPTDLKWNGDLANPDSGSTSVPYDEAKDIWAPFLTGPLTPALILYVGVIIATAGLLLRVVSIRIEKPDYERWARYSVQLAVVLFWAALGILVFYFLNIQSNSRGIDLLESVGAILVVIGSIALIPITMPYDFESM